MAEVDVNAVASLSGIRQRLVSKLVVVGVLAVLIYGVLLFAFDFDRIRGSAANVNGWALLGALLLSTGNYAVRFLRWHYYLSRLGVSIPVRESAVVFLAGFAMTVSPAKIGEVLKSLLLYRSHRTPVAKTAPIVVAERVTDVAGLAFLAALGSLAFPFGAPIAFVGAGLVTAILAACCLKSVGELLLGLAEKVPGVRRFTPSLRGAYASLHELTQPRSALLATSLSTVAWGLQCMALYLLVGSFEGAELSVIGSCVAYSAPLLAGTLAMLPGGLGLTELSMVGALMELGGQGMTAPVATTVTILVRLVTFWWALLIGFGALVRWRLRS